MKTLQQDKSALDLHALYQETKPPSPEAPTDLHTLYETTKPDQALADAYWKARSSVQPRGPDESVGQIAREAAGAAVTGTGMVGEAFGRLGESVFREDPGEFAGPMQRMQYDAPGGLRRTGADLKQAGEQYDAEGRAAFRQEHPLVSAAANLAGTAAPFVVGTALAPEGMAPVAGAAIGSAMMDTQFRDVAKAHGLNDKDAAIAGHIGAIAGGTAGVLSSVMGPISRLLGRLPLPAKDLLGIFAKNAANGSLTMLELNIADNLTASSWVGYDKDRKLLDGALQSAELGAGAGVVASLLGLGVAARAGKKAAKATPEPIVQPEPSQEVLEPAKAAEVPAVEAATVEAPQTAEQAPEAAKAPIETPPSREPAADGTPPSEATRSEAVVPVDETPKKAEPKQEGSTGAAPLNQAEQSDLTSIMNAFVDADAASMERDAPARGEKSTGKALVAGAVERLAADPKAGEALVTELKDKPRTISKEEVALLVVDRVRLRRERDAARKALDEANETGVGVEAAQKRVNDAVDAVYAAGEATALAGTSQGQSLQARQLILREDYSPEEMERAVRDARGGEPLAPEHMAEITALHDEIDRVTKAHSELVARNKELEAQAAAKGILPAIKERVKRSKAARVPSEFREKLSKDADASRQALKTIAFGGIPVDALPHLANIGADLIVKGATEFKAWSEAIVAEVGERVRPHLEEAFAAAKKLLDDAQEAHLTARVGERRKAGKDIGAYVQKIALGFVRKGVGEIEPLIDAVHGVLKKVDPKITREQTRDMISGYGKFRALTKDTAKRTLQDLKGQGQKLAQIEALEKKQAPKKTGFERVEPSQENRKLRKKVNQLRKETGIVTTDPAKALKTALDQRETYLRNRIEDLREEIDTGELSVPVEKPSPTNETIAALEAELEGVRKQHEATFGKKEMSDLDRANAAIRADEKELAENERRIRDRDLSLRLGRQGPPTADVAAARAKHTELKLRNQALRDEIEWMRALTQDRKPSAEEVSLQKKIDEFDKPSVKLGQKQGPDTQAVGELKAKLKVLRDARAADPKRIEALRLKALKSRLALSTEKLRSRIERGDFERPKPKEPVKLDPEAVALKAADVKAKSDFEKYKEKHRRENRTTARKALDAALETANLQRALYSSFDISAPFRQGGLLMFGQNPIESAKVIGKAVRAGASEDFARKTDAEIRSDPVYEFAKASKLDLTSLDHEPGGPREEAIHSNLSDRIPGVRASNRAFITPLNLLRLGTFKMAVRAIPGTPTLADGRAIAHAVNVFSGRGSAKFANSAMPVLSAVLWAPRLLLSRLQFLTGEPIITATPATRPVIAKMYARTLIGYAAMYGLYHMLRPDRETEFDWRSSDFLKLKTGESTTNDPAMGLSQIGVLLGQLFTGERKKLIGGRTVPIRGPGVPYGGANAWDVSTNFLRKKLTPALGTATNLIAGEDVVGNKATIGTESGYDTVKGMIDWLRGEGDLPDRVQGAFIPLSVGDIYAAMRAEGLSDAMVSSILGLLGMSSQTITRRAK